MKIQKKISQLNMEDSKKLLTQTCEFCEYKDGENPDVCSICLRHLCKSVRNGQSACSPCIEKAIEAKILQKDEIGRYLDPAKRIPLPTCLCGKFWSPMNYTCFIAAINKNPNHRLLR